MQNKANLLDAQMNVNSFHAGDYENKSNWKLGENKANTNPIKPNFRKAQMNVASVITKYYENKRLCRRGENKPNQTQFHTQRLGFFGRYGWAGSKVNEVTNFWSAGIQYQGLIPDRDDDVLALGFAQGIFSNQAAAYIDDYETVCELYYNAQITSRLAISPSIQYIANPGGDGTASDVVVLGVRAQISF